MKVFVSYTESDKRFDNCIMDIEHMPQSKDDITNMERTIKHINYHNCRCIPYIKILIIVPV